ncbi:uncharacterized protein LOC143482991 [Brachyhypopomus gauderio]|uniref:uncharacterized protein LOC143482991 n=1 Tax=Brachyhypopomus gauderio TaxID=698409 RepID=UPI004043740A
MLLLTTLAFLCNLSWGLPKDVDEDAVKVVLVSGVPVGLLSDGDYNMTLVARSIDALINAENDSYPNDLTYVPSRECSIKGQRVVLLSDRSGKDMLALYRAHDGVTTRVPEGSSLEQRRDDDVLGSQQEEECCKLLEKRDRRSDGTYTITVVVVVLATVALTALILSFTMLKNHGVQVGGVLGSIIHYPPASSLDKSSEGHNKELSNVPLVFNSILRV